MSCCVFILIMVYVLSDPSNMMWLIIILLIVVLYNLFYGWKTRRVTMDTVTAFLLSGAPEPTQDIAATAKLMKQVDYTDDVEGWQLSFLTFSVMSPSQCTRSFGYSSK
jgi:hypothetical protein